MGTDWGGQSLPRGVSPPSSLSFGGAVSCTRPELHHYLSSCWICPCTGLALVGRPSPCSLVCMCLGQREHPSFYSFCGPDRCSLGLAVQAESRELNKVKVWVSPPPLASLLLLSKHQLPSLWTQNSSDLPHSSVRRTSSGFGGLRGSQEGEPLEQIPSFPFKISLINIT